MRRRSFLALIAGAGACARAGPARALEARLAGVYAWREVDPRFGGLSALHVMTDRRTALALSDRGTIFTARIDRDAGGRIVSATVTGAYPLRGPDGAVLGSDRRDAEGIAVGRDGRVYISFEGADGGRILRYDRVGARASVVPVPPAFAAFRVNKGPEALAVDPEGALWTLPEDPRSADFPLFRQAGGRWTQPAMVTRIGDYLPVAADFGPDGRLYIAERRHRLPLRFGTRVRRFAAGQGGAGEVVLETQLGQHDNLEGLQVWRDGKGRMRATLVSDDNFLIFQRTEIVEYFLPS